MKYLYPLICVFLIISFASAKEKSKGVPFPTENKFIHDACISKDGKVIVCTDNKTLKAFSVSDKTLIRNFSDGHRSHVLCLDLAGDGTLLASGGSDSTVVLRDFNTGAIIQQINDLGGKITSIKFSPNNQFILFGCSNSLACLYSIKEKKIIKTFIDQKMDVSSVAFSSNGHLFATAGGDKIIRIYNAENLQLISELKGHKDWIRSIGFYNQDKNLISCGDDNCIFQWNLSRLKYDKIRVFTHWILTVDIEDIADGNSNLYVYGSMNGSVKIKYRFGSYKTKLNYPVSKVIILPNDDGFIEIAVATLGKGLLYMNAYDMTMMN